MDIATCFSETFCFIHNKVHSSWAYLVTFINHAMINEVILLFDITLLCFGINQMTDAVSKYHYMAKQQYVTHLHETSLMLHFLHVKFNTPFCRVWSVLHIGENQKLIIFFYPKLWNLKTAKTSNLKSHNDEKMAVKEKEPYFNII